MNNNEINNLIKQAESNLHDDFVVQEDISLINTQRVLDAFKKNKVAPRHFSSTEGYGYDDIGRDTLCSVYADVFETEAAIVSPNILSGTHAITVALFGILRPKDILLSVSGNPYDTLKDTISGDKGSGSLYDFGISYQQIDLKEGKIDSEKVKEFLIKNKTKAVYVQRSRGYEWRDALNNGDIRLLVELVKNVSPETKVLVDNCYGEFVDIKEPTAYGADLCIGSLIKNIGGGLAPTGGYIAGKKDLIELISYRFTSPSIGMEIGSYASGYRVFFQGLFIAPHTVLQAKKSAMLFSAVFEKLGYQVLPRLHQKPNDIICSIKFNDKKKLIDFCQMIQSCSPVDSFVTPLPWEMPGYCDRVIMAAGCFVNGSSIELSCDSPIKEPYIAYLQGALTYEHAKIALTQILKKY